MNFKQTIANQLINDIETLMRLNGVTYYDAKEIVKNNSVAGVAVWNIVDRHFQRGDYISIAPAYYGENKVSVLVQRQIKAVIGFEMDSDSESVY